MKKQLLIDSDVLIDYLRGREEAIRFLEQNNNFMCISVITVAELYAGVRDGKERAVLDNFIDYFNVLPINLDIARKGGLFRRDYFKSCGVGLADALIAATALSADATLVTLNRKHFPMVRNLMVPYKKF